MMRHELGKWNLDELIKNPTRTIFDQKLAKIESNAKRFDWSLVQNIKINKPWFISGGINIDNIEEINKKLIPYGIDISSGVEEKPGITNNQAEYLAIISALKKFENSNDEIIIYSDSKNTVNQLNHEFAINNEQLRSLARESWSLIAKFSNLKLRWVPRSENLAGKMLGS